MEGCGVALVTSRGDLAYPPGWRHHDVCQAAPLAAVSAVAGERRARQWSRERERARELVDNMTTLNPGSKVFKLVLRRNDQSESWGFRLQGGKDFPMPVSVAMVSHDKRAFPCSYYLLFTLWVSLFHISTLVLEHVNMPGSDLFIGNVVESWSGCGMDVRIISKQLITNASQTGCSQWCNTD